MTTKVERQAFPELDREFVEAYTSTFIHRRDCYPLQIKNGTYATVEKPLTYSLLLDHFKGKVTLGAYALDEHSLAHWICFDADEEKQWEQIKELASDLTSLHISAYLEPSRRGGHVWLFTPEITGLTARLFARQLLAERDIKAIEIYPKQNQLTTGVGSFVRLPLGIHRKSGKRYHFVTLDGQPLAPTIREQMALLASPFRVPQAFIDETIACIPPPEPKPPPTPKYSPDKGLPLSEQIKQSISVLAFVRAYVDLDPQGRGFCPFHDDQHKSFGVNEKSNFWHCYAGCGGGSIIDFWMKWREIHGEDSRFKVTLHDLARLLL